jgi:hypothetical protein
MSVSSALSSYIGKQISFSSLAFSAVPSLQESTLVQVLLGQGVWILSFTNATFTTVAPDGINGYSIRFEDVNGQFGYSSWNQVATSNTFSFSQTISSPYDSDGVNPVSVICDAVCIAPGGYNISAGTLYAMRIA